jgi:threonylcarbamoyladenosine tRNA methylthiotransferase CDKAL1
MNIYIETYGCTANKSDERLLVGLLEQHHHRVVAGMKDADLLVLLTCTVIGTTEQRMLSRLRVFQKTGKKIIVTGCMPAVQPQLITAVAPHAFLVPARRIQTISDLLDGAVPGALGKTKASFPKSHKGAIAPISIAEGCQQSCSYCITRVARGRLQSFPAEEIIMNICSALQQGCKEIQLTAQDTASYGRDIGTDLGALLDRAASLPGTYRLRVGMMNPATARDHIGSIIQGFQHPTVYKFLHMPVQSGDDEILRNMNRGYSANGFLELVEQFRTVLPDMTVSTDVIIGFPGETDDQFRRTVELLQTVNPDIINITRFSARPLTPAKTMKGRVPTHVMKTRSRTVAELCAGITLAKNQEHIGRTYMVLTTEKGKHNTVAGRAENYKQVILREPVGIGEFVPVEIIEASTSFLVGRLI